MAQMPNDDLQQQLMSLFVVEAQEHLQVLNQNLLRLESEPVGDARGQLLADTMREAHSLKGAARAVNQKEIETVAHHLENLFVYLQNNLKILSSEEFNILFQSLDSIGNLVGNISGKKVDVSNLDALLSDLNELLQAIQFGLVEKSQKSSSTRKVKNVRRQPKKEEHLADAEKSKGSDENEINKVADVQDQSEIYMNKEGQTDVGMQAEKQDGLKRQPIESASESFKQEDTIRLTTAKLDSLLSLMGEFRVAHIANKHRLIELKEMRKNVYSWESDWRKVRASYQKAIISNEIEYLPGDRNSLIPTGRLIKTEIDKPVFEFLQENESNLKTIRIQIDTLIQTFEESERRMDQCADEMEDEIRKTRMMPISTVFNIFPRILRDLAQEKKKDIRLVLSGGDTEVDRTVLEQIRDPLLHMVRNCVDHGIEIPEVRLKSGKESQGTICMKAEQQGDSLVLEISDDGSGINLAELRATAVKRKIVSKEMVNDLSDREIVELIFQPGFSTSPDVNELSGRGVGLDIVHQHIEDLHGLINIENSPGRGLKFILTVPLTVSTTNCLLVQAGGRKVMGKYYPMTFAIPITNVLLLMRLAQEDIGSVEGHLAIRMEDEPVALWHLTGILGLNKISQLQNEETKKAILVKAAEKQVALLVDAILGTQEIVIKNLPWPMMQVSNIIGASLLGSGEIVIALNMSELISSLDANKTEVTISSENEQHDDERVPVIMIADDSITTRTLEKNILEAAGYQVLTASDGLNAWLQMQTEPCDLLVSDIMMPRLDGFGLTKRARSDERFKHLPIILVTSLDQAEDREKGLEAGADAYIVKSSFDQEKLINTIQRLI